MLARSGPFLVAAIWLGALLFSGGGCVPVPPEMLAQLQAQQSSNTAVANVYPGLDAGAADAQSLHFVAHAYGQDKARQDADLAEQDYQRIMQDTGLMSFLSGDQYQLTVYASNDEYHKKSNMPAWSGGVTVQNAIYSYEGPALSSTLSHEMTHVIFNEFMVRQRPELRWINEGLAVYEEIQASPDQAKAAWGQRMEQARTGNLTFSQMTQAQPLTEADKDVNAWYAQVASVTQFMINKGGRLGMQQFLTQLKNGATTDAALSSAFPAMWSTMDQLEQDWRRNG